MSTTNKMLIILIIVQLVSCKPLIVDSEDNSDSNGHNTTATSTSISSPSPISSSPLPLLITCRSGEFIRRDCKYYIDCYKGRWRRNFCPETKYWNHEIKKCDILENVPECLAMYLDMKHSPINPGATNQLTDEEKLKVDKLLDTKKPKPKHKISPEDEMVVEEVGIIDKKSKDTTDDQNQSKATDSKSKQATDKPKVKPKNYNPGDNPDSSEEIIPKCTHVIDRYTVSINLEPLFRLAKTIFYHLSLIAILLKE